MPQLLGMAIPIDTPDPVKAAITKAFTAAMNSQALKKILEAQVAGALWMVRRKGEQYVEEP